MRLASRALLLLALLSMSVPAFAQEAGPSTAKIEITALLRDTLPNGFVCPAGMWTWSPEKVIQSRIDAMKTANVDQVMCTYAHDAVVMMPGAVLKGRVQIRAAFESMFQMMGGVPEITSFTAEGPIVQTTSTLDTPVFSIPDGSDTFVIMMGHVRYQTVHNPMVFKTPAP